MKKQLTLTTAVAAALTALGGCSSTSDWDEDVIAAQDTAVCVDSQGYRVDDDLCDDDWDGYRSGYSHYYIRRSARLPYYGETIHDRRFAGAGSFLATPGTSYARAPVSTRMTRSAAVSRGGLGSSGRSFGGGRS